MRVRQRTLLVCLLGSSALFVHAEERAKSQKGLPPVENFNQELQTPSPALPTPQLVSEGLAGYISMEVPAPPEEYGYGVSLYATAWPLVERPLRDFQIGLASIWIVPENRKINTPLLPRGTVARDNWPERGPSYRDVFQTIEGGLGFWGSTHFGADDGQVPHERHGQWLQPRDIVAGMGIREYQSAPAGPDGHCATQPAPAGSAGRPDVSERNLRRPPGLCLDGAAADRSRNPRPPACPFPPATSAGRFSSIPRTSKGRWRFTRPSPGAVSPGSTRPPLRGDWTPDRVW